ncbi:MAG: hypothetical protein VXZ82_05945 [Planctomycetota bacterium]|nr:hypothetical protein [Planctomycetota bacterium]
MRLVVSYSREGLVSLTSTERKERPIEGVLAPIMFGLSLLFLAVVAVTLVLWVEPWGEFEAASETATAQSDSSSETLAVPLSADARESLLRFQTNAFWLGNWSFMLLSCLWPLFLLEQAFHILRLRSWSAFRGMYPFSWLYLLFPPLRMCAQRRGEVNEVWLPKWGWQQVDRSLRRRLERVFSVPMIWIALLILPVLGLPFLFKEQMSEHPWLRALIHMGTGVIWFAFTVEFIVMLSVARDKLKYCKTHWLDLAIILLPFVSFLRSLRVLRTSNLVNASRLSRVAKMVRAYRLRGVAMRGFRALLGLELLHRLLRSTPERRIEKLEKMRAEKLRELEDIDEQIENLKLLAASQNEEATPDDSRSESEAEQIAASPETENQ